ncbi:galactose-specific lectin nattectin-like [Triplophysa dalaica]|uniref:galactose-specific lectin nattectin-like n=1 Tax=Triplophysa dalaica TaxID=1582913 RepID=UPI0024E01BA9|nr:galactose-specific lectin nattectin-like [Triplophysa dalaica]
MPVIRGLALVFLVFFVENAAACPFGWTPFETHCYRFFPQRQNWATAEKFCQASAANLASVRTRAHNNFLLSLVPRNSRAWIGGHDGEKESRWLWSDGSPFNYANWCFWEPNNLRRSEHCLEINKTRRRCWNDESCYAYMGYICAQTRL